MDEVGLACLGVLFAASLTGIEERYRRSLSYFGLALATLVLVAASIWLLRADIGTDTIDFITLDAGVLTWTGFFLGHVQQ